VAASKTLTQAQRFLRARMAANTRWSAPASRAHQGRLAPRAVRRRSRPRWEAAPGRAHSSGEAAAPRLHAGPGDRVEQGPRCPQGRCRRCHLTEQNAAPTTPWFRSPLWGICGCHAGRSGAGRSGTGQRIKLIRESDHAADSRPTAVAGRIAEVLPDDAEHPAGLEPAGRLISGHDCLSRL
jgi:hypothetical protein